MILDVPERALHLLAEIELLHEHDDNGPGMVVCPVCSGHTTMQWKNGERLDQPSDLVHDSGCPRQWAKRVLQPNTTNEPPAGSASISELG